MTNDQQGETGVKSAPGVAAVEKTKGRKKEEKEESSTSTGSDGGKGNSSGSGSGSGGYNADCSSSDSSSNNDAATRVAEKQKSKSNINNSTPTSKCDDIIMGEKTVTSKTRVNTTSGNTSTNNHVGTVAASPTIDAQSEGERRSRHGNASSHKSTSNDFSDTSIRQDDHHDFDSAAKELGACLPQWNGITIEHPMDPRIDLSTVDFRVGASHLATFATNIIDIKTNSDTGSIRKLETDQNVAPSHQDNNIPSKNENDIDSPVVPSPEQYTKLLEVCNTKA